MYHQNKLLSFEQLRKCFLITLLCAFSPFCSNGQIRYVKSVASGTGDGSSWANASGNLEAMIQASAVGNEVWVKSGTYYPTDNPYAGSSQITSSDPRDKTFHIKPGVKVYGGFAGIETAISQRDIPANPTVLSGDLGVLGDSTDNAYHVVLFAMTSGVSTTSYLDGFTVSGGNANGTGTLATFITATKRDSGGNIYINRYASNISNCTIKSGFASNGGGGTFIYRCLVVFDKVKWSHNSCIGDGGAIKNDNNTSSVVLASCDISNNTASNSGGCFSSGQSPSLIIKRSSITNNHAVNQGGGIDITACTNLLIDSCSIIGNTSLYGAGMYLTNSTVTISNNSISENNTGNGIGAGIRMNNCLADISKNRFLENTGGGGGAISLAANYCHLHQNYFFGNSVNGNGGAITFSPNTSPISATNNNMLIEQNIFEGNTANTFGSTTDGLGGAFMSYGGLQTFKNNLFFNNSTNYRGGAIYGQSCFKNFINNTFYNNNAGGLGGAIYQTGGQDTMLNNLFFNNLSGGSTSIVGADMSTSLTTAVLDHNSLQFQDILGYPFATVNTNNLFQIDPLFISETDPNGLDDTLFTSDDGLSLSLCSPLVDVANGDVNAVTDILGNGRLQYNGIDFGAYEVGFENSVPSPVILVGGGAFCIGDSGVVVGLDTMFQGVSYQLFLDSVPTGNPIDTDSALDFGLQTAAGTYTVLSTNIGTGCQKINESTITISINPLPNVQIIFSPNVICEGQTITFYPQGGDSYQWSDSTIINGSPFLPVDGEAYVLTGVDANGCVNTDTLVAESYPVPDNSVSVVGVTITAGFAGGTYQWISCDSQTPIVGEINQSYTPSENGDYAVIIGNTNCSDTSDCIEIHSVSLDELDIKHLVQIFPNPTSEVISIVSDSKIVKWEISDLNGKILLSGNDINPIDVSSLNSGIYLVSCEIESGLLQQKKIVKQ